MSIVKLSLAKAHLKAVGNAEDELIQLYIDAAETWFANYIGKPLADLNPLPADLKVAVLRQVAFYYEMRGTAVFGASMHLAPHNVLTIADSYRKRWFGEPEPEAISDDF